jgi:ketosteroid isomerase-like protein
LNARLAVVGVVAGLVALAIAGHAEVSTPAEPSGDGYLARYRDALGGMFRGDPTHWMALASHADDATLFPPFGGYEQGWNPIRARYQAAVDRMSPGFQDFDIEVLAYGESGDLAYVVALERSHFQPDASAGIQAGFTRVTQIFRREQGQWRLLHRHMDHLPEQFTLPAN